MKKISILGMGRWASCIAYILDSGKHKITMWERGTSGDSELFKTHKNQYLTLPENISFTHNLEQAVQSADVIVISILSQNLQDLTEHLKQVDGYNKKCYCIAMKGIEATTGRRLSEVLIDGGIPRENIAVWAGPGHVQALANGGVTNMLISAYNTKLAKELANEFTTKNIAITVSYDILGTELCAACKNVYGIAAGVLHAYPKYNHCIGSLMVASVKELAGLIDALGGNPASANGLALLGDYQATMFDEYSKNLTFGKLIIEHNTLDEQSLNKFIKVCSVEGIKTAEAILKLRDAYNLKVSDAQKLELYIINTVHKIVTGNISLSKAGDVLFEKICKVLEN